MPHDHDGAGRHTAKDASRLRGSCVCGDVGFRVEGALSAPSACHCSRCRKGTGHYWAAARVSQDDLVLEKGNESLAWFPMKTAERGFCVICGAFLFWRPLEDHSAPVSVSLGAIDGDTGLHVTKHIHVAHKGDYYDLPPSAEAHDGDG